MVTIPTEYTPIPLEQLTGQVNFANDPLRDILKNTNYLYGNHQPALANMMGIGPAGTQNTFYYPVVPSVDGLDYTVRVHTWSGSAQTITVTVDTSTANTTAGWTANSSGSAVHSASGEQWDTTDTAFTIASNVRYLRIRAAAGASCQLHSCIIYPTALTSTTATKKTSGFVPFDSTHLDDAANGPAIHTEYFDRAKENCRAVLSDRRQAVWSFCNNVDRLDTFNDIGNIAVRVMALAQSTMIGQAGATVTVRYRIAGGATATVNVDGTSAGTGDLTSDDTDRTATITTTTDKPAFRASTTPATVAQTPYYICIDWRPGD